MIRTTINAGVCGLHSTVAARSDDMQMVTLQIASDCEKIRGLAEELKTPIDSYQEIGDGSDGIVLRAARSYLKGCSVMRSTPSTVDRIRMVRKEGLISGRLLHAGDVDAAVADRHFAALFSIKPGDTLHLGDKDYHVVGVAEQKQSSQAGVANVYLPLAAAEALAGVPAGDVNQVYARLADASRTDEVVKALSLTLGKLSAISQQSILQVMGGVSRVTARFSAAAGLLGAIGGIALAWAALSGLMAERRREIGIMKAVGWRTRDIVRTFLSESAILSICGGIVGTGIGLVLALSLAGLPTPAPSLQHSLPGLAAAPMPAASVTLPIEVSPTTLALALLISAAGGTLTGWLGARRAAGLKTAQVFRDA